MTALLLLQGVAFALLALGALARFAPGRAPVLVGSVCLIGLATALAAPDAALQAGLSFRVDGFSSMVLAALFLLGMSGVQPVVLGALVLAVLAADGVGLVLFLAGAVVAGVLGAPAPNRRGLAHLLPLVSGEGLAEGLAAVGCAIVALLLLSWPDLSFAAISPGPAEGIRGAVILFAALGAAVLLPSGPVGVYLIGRMLLGLAGPVTPGWWGVPVLLLGAGVAVLGARRAAASEDLELAAGDAGQAALGVVVMGLGAALLARGADLATVAVLAVAGALLQLLALAVWGALTGLCAGVIRDGVGSTALARLGGLLRRVPVTGLALLVGLLSMSALPLLAGFPGVWLVLQGLLGVGRAGGVGGLLLVAGAASALGVTLALLAAAAVRLAGVVLLGAPRTGKAASAVEPGLHVRLGMAALIVALVVLGVCPFLGVALVQPGVRLLAGAVASGTGPWLLASTGEAPGYSAPLVCALLAAAAGLAVWVSRGADMPAPPWRGGFGEDGAARGNTWPLVLWPHLREWRPPVTQRTWLVVLALVLAAAVGWAAR